MCAGCTLASRPRRGGVATRPQPAVAMLAVMFPPLHVLHADTALVVANKPADLLAVPGRGEAGQRNLTAQVQAAYPDALVVHRLDMATSGLLLFARGARMQQVLSAAFEARRVHKRYEAVVQGGPHAECGEITLPLAADWPRRPLQKVDHAHGRPSHTRWHVLSRDGALTRLALEPLTGRSHQLRVHCAAMGWPIAGDPLYGDADSAPRLLLHAAGLALAHPRSGAALHWQSPAPF